MTQVVPQLSKGRRVKTIIGSSFITLVMVCSMIWYNAVLQFYYIVHLKQQNPEGDKYFSVVYYTTIVLNQANFFLLLFMAYIVQ